MVERTGRAFVVRPFGSKSNKKGEAVIDFERVHEELVSAALDDVGLTGGTTEEFIQQGNIRTDMFRQLLAADLVVADISIHNANAFYELGIRHALRDQYTVLIRSNKRGDAHVFDLRADRYLSYDPDDPAASIERLAATIRATLKDEDPDSPVFELLPGLTSFSPSKVVVVPLQVREKVAQVARDAEELRALHDDIAGEAWETEAFRVIGNAQFKLGDHEGASRTWERVREFDTYDVEANQRLATSYQKLGEHTLSEQAAARALLSTTLTDWDRAETWALIGSNQKTRWHLGFESEPDSEERQRKALTSPFLEKSYESYAKGFEMHRSHYYSGFNAVAMLAMQVELAQLHPDVWALGFKNDRHSGFELEHRQEHLARLVAATDLAIETSVQNYQEDEWAPVTRADLMLIVADGPEKVRFNYERCASLPAFNVSSLKRQLGIYRSLGLFDVNVGAAFGWIDENPGTND